MRFCPTRSNAIDDRAVRRTSQSHHAEHLRMRMRGVMEHQILPKTRGVLQHTIDDVSSLLTVMRRHRSQFRVGGTHGTRSALWVRAPASRKRSSPRLGSKLPDRVSLAIIAWSSIRVRWWKRGWHENTTMSPCRPAYAHIIRDRNDSRPYISSGTRWCLLTTRLHVISIHKINQLMRWYLNIIYNKWRHLSF